MKISDEIGLQFWAGRPFRSSEAQAAAFADPRYKNSSDFRAAVHNKIRLTDDSIGAIVNVTGQQQIVYAGESAIGAGNSVAEAEAAEQEFAAKHGAMAVRPVARARVQELNAAEGSQWNKDGQISTRTHADF